MTTDTNATSSTSSTSAAPSRPSIPPHRRRHGRRPPARKLPWRVRARGTREEVGVIWLPGVPLAHETLFHELRRQGGITYPGPMTDLEAELAEDLCPAALQEELAAARKTTAEHEAGVEGARGCRHSPFGCPSCPST